MTAQKHHEFQVQLIHHCKLNEGRFPDLELIHAIPMGEKRDKRTGAKLKAEGAKAGIPDLFLPVARITPMGLGGLVAIDAIGLYIEIKIGKDTLSPEQKWWKKRLERQGFYYYIARDTKNGMMDALRYLIGYLGGTL